MSEQPGSRADIVSAQRDPIAPLRGLARGFQHEPHGGLNTGIQVHLVALQRGVSILRRDRQRDRGIRRRIPQSDLRDAIGHRSEVVVNFRIECTYIRLICRQRGQSRIIRDSSMRGTLHHQTISKAGIAHSHRDFDLVLPGSQRHLVTLRRSVGILRNNCHRSFIKDRCRGHCRGRHPTGHNYLSVVKMSGIEGFFRFEITERQRLQASVGRRTIGVDDVVMRIGHP